MDKAERNLSWAEVLFVDIFCSLFGDDKRDYLIRHHNVPFKDTEGRTRLHDFVIVTPKQSIAIEIESDTYHNPLLVSVEKFSDDLLRGNAQILQGWLRLSYTPRNLSENVEIVKTQLKGLIGDSPTLIEYNYDEDEDEILSAPPTDHPRATAARQAAWDFGRSFVTDHPFLSGKAAGLVTKSSPSPEDFMGYVLFRGLGQVYSWHHEWGRLPTEDEVAAFFKIYDNESSRDALEFIRILPFISPADDHKSYSVLKIALTRWAEDCEKRPSRLAAFAKSTIFLHCKVFERFQITAEGELDSQYFMRDEFQGQQRMLWATYMTLSMLFQYLSLKLGKPRTAIIGVTHGGGEFCYTLLDKTQYYVQQPAGTAVPSPFYEGNMPAITYLASLDGSKVRKLLMGDNKFVGSEMLFNLPAAAEALKGPLQDLTFLSFNHAMVNRYFVELNPSEFIIKAYNVKSITLLDACQQGRVEYYFKVKYTDETIEVGNILLEPNHTCDYEWCPFEKYGLSFVPIWVESTRCFQKGLEEHEMFSDYYVVVTNLKRLQTIIALCLRDLNVMEVETKDYVKQRVVVKANGKEKKGTQWTKIIWVPRKKIIYNRNNVEKLRTFKEKINEIIPVMVAGHLRHVENPSPKQLEIAKEYGVFPPPGFTFIRPHTRGIDQNILTRYRSRSALMILYSED